MIVFSDISLALLVSLPLLLLFFKFNNLAYDQKIKRLAFPFWFANLIFVQHMLNNGDTFWIVLSFQLIFIYPISVFVFLVISEGKTDGLSKSFTLGLKRRQLIVSIVISVLSLIGIGWGMVESNQKVTDLHNQIMNELAESDEPEIYLIYHTSSPETLLSILPILEEVKGGEVRVTSLPWRSTVQVIYETDIETWKRSFTYVRFNDGWKLDGMYKEEFQNLTAPLD
ncbi:hypothetical protein [Alkalihalobacterium elongatum]|uniref:hypothetical protein n=1 Tax=Alkalihalobacterium elongatum TaxID=2675466 RepID=UPI001C1F6583|nr:hypothetical protein [Alkalihalobacterium elongatum]